MGNSLKSFKQPSSIAYKPLISVSENENLRVFTFTELKKATKKFRPDMVVDVVGYYCSVRTFYKCYIDKTTFALSRTETGIAASVLERNSFPYTLQDFETILLYIVLMFLSTEEEALPWEIRVKIAIGTAQGLAFIHSIKNNPLDQELRMHNIMLDEQYNAKLLYLESNEQCLENVRTIIGDVYNSPGCCNGNILESETDVFTFGVMLLELLTGSKDAVRNERSKSSGVWTSLLSDDHKIEEIIDPRLGNNYHVNAATQMGTLIRRCTKWDKMNRPSMQQVLDTLNYIAEIKD